MGDRFWGRFRRAIESADAALLASIATYDDVLVSLTADVATNYVQIRTLDERLQIARNNTEVQRESLNIAEIRFRGGTTSERDVQQARTVLASTEASIPQLEAALVQTKNALSVLLGMPPSPLEDLLAGSKAIPVAPPQVAVGIPRSCCDDARTSVPPSCKPRRRARKSASPRPISIRRSR